MAQKTPNIPVAIVCADHSSAMDSSKQVYDLGLIDPIFIGKKELIKKEADKLGWNIKNLKIIDHKYDQDAAIAGAELAKNNKIKIIIKGNLHFF